MWRINVCIEISRTARKLNKEDSQYQGSKSNFFNSETGLTVRGSDYSIPRYVVIKFQSASYAVRFVRHWLKFSANANVLKINYEWLQQLLSVKPRKSRNRRPIVNVHMFPFLVLQSCGSKNVFRLRNTGFKTHQVLCDGSSHSNCITRKIKVYYLFHIIYSLNFACCPVFNISQTHLSYNINLRNTHFLNWYFNF
jgi:hypothetical protein